MVREVEMFLNRINKEARLDDGTFYRLLVACTEAVNNAILHGNGTDPKKRVLIVCLVYPRLLKIRVHDEGRGFNTRNLPNPLEERNILKEHGRGVFLMKSLVDKVGFRRLKKGMVVEMIIDLKMLR